jgi:hypothetical protein
MTAGHTPDAITRADQFFATPTLPFGRTVF